MFVSRLSEPKISTMLIAALVCAALLCGCGTGAGSGVPVLPDDTGLTAGLPAPGELALARTASADPVIRHGGGDFDPTLPNNLVTPGGLYIAQTEPGTPWAFNDYAYACYRFTITDPGIEPQLAFDWETALYPAMGIPPVRLTATYYAGLANWDSGRWDWYEGSQRTMLELGSLEQYIDDDGTLLVFLMVEGYNYYFGLNFIRVGLNHEADSNWTEHAHYVGSGINKVMLAIGEDDVPVVAWGSEYDPDRGRLGPVVARFTGGEFQPETVDGVEYDSFACNLEVTPDNNPCFVYRTGTYYHAATADVDGWTHTELPDGYVPASTEALIFNEAGLMNLALIDREDEDLYLGVYDGTGWSLDLVTGAVRASLLYDQATALCFDPAGNPLIGWIMGVQPHLGLSSAGGWQAEPVSTDMVFEVALAVDSVGDPHMILRDYGNTLGGNLLYAHRVESAWEVAPLGPEDPGCYHPALALLSDGTPVVAYNTRHNNEIIAGFLTDGEWRMETVHPNVSLLYLDLEVDSADKVWIACENYDGEVVLFERSVE